MIDSEADTACEPTALKKPSIPKTAITVQIVFRPDIFMLQQGLRPIVTLCLKITLLTVLSEIINSIKFLRRIWCLFFIYPTDSNYSALRLK
jgi:hypothetical protein